jgi:hypothetical protein
MVIYFTEEDLISFGEYMVSPQRRQLFRDKPNPEGLSLDERLAMVHDADLSNWAYLASTNRQVMDEINNEDKVIN